MNGISRFDLNTEGEKISETKSFHGSSDLKYLEIDDLSHLIGQAAKEGEEGKRAWRESYYFHLTDPEQGITIITTIGILPNKSRSAGFVLIIKDGRLIHSRIIMERAIHRHRTDQFSIGPLSYNVDGIDWVLNYRSRSFYFNINVSPINPFFSYSDNADKILRQLMKQHIEQAASFTGRISIDDKKYKLSGHGHRDHSWGIRDWVAVDGYRLVCATFSDDFAVNVWKGWKGSQEFLEGYIFDGRNRRVVEAQIKDLPSKDPRSPIGGQINLVDEKGKKVQIDCKVIASVPIPLPGCFVVETVSEFRYNGNTAYGLFEHHFRSRDPFTKMNALWRLWRTGR